MPSVGRWLHWCPKVVAATCGEKKAPGNLKILEDLIYRCVTVINLLEYLEISGILPQEVTVLPCFIYIFPGAQVPAIGAMPCHRFLLRHHLSTSTYI